MVKHAPDTYIESFGTKMFSSLNSYSQKEHHCIIYIVALLNLKFCVSTVIGDQGPIIVVSFKAHSKDPNPTPRCLYCLTIGGP